MRYLSTTMKTLIFISVLFLLACGVHADDKLSDRVYRWVDDDGQVQYTQYPPPDKDYTEIAKPAVTEEQAAEQAGGDAASPPAASAASSAEGLTPKEQANRNCVTATNNLALLETSSTQIVYYGSDGKSVNLPDEERAARIEQAKQNIAEFCQ